MIVADLWCLGGRGKRGAAAIRGGRKARAATIMPILRLPQFPETEVRASETLRARHGVVFGVASDESFAFAMLERFAAAALAFREGEAYEAMLPRVALFPLKTMRCGYERFAAVVDAPRSESRIWVFGDDGSLAPRQTSLAPAMQAQPSAAVQAQQDEATAQNAQTSAEPLQEPSAEPAAQEEVTHSISEENNAEVAETTHGDRVADDVLVSEVSVADGEGGAAASPEKKAQRQPRRSRRRP